MEKKLYKSTTDKKIAGVCGGIAKYFGIDATIVRVILVVLVLACGIGILPYIICALVIPNEPEQETINTIIKDENNSQNSNSIE